MKWLQRRGRMRPRGRDFLCGQRSARGGGGAAGGALNAALAEVGRLADALVSGAGEAGELSATGRDGVDRLKPAPPRQAGAGRIVSEPLKLASSSDSGDALRAALEEVGRLAGVVVGGGERSEERRVG